MQKLAWHFDFHSNRNIRINHDPDTAGLARALRENGVEEIISFAKCHTGFAYYPTRVGTVHPRMRGDAFGEVVRACKGEGLRVLAYISFGIDGEAARRHPDWAHVFEEGAHSNPDWFISVCPFTAYQDELMLPMIAEVLERYPVDGFFFDTMAALSPCYCAACAAAFRAAHGCELPRAEGDPGWKDFGRFRRERGMALIDATSAFIVARRPGSKVGFNQIGTLRYPEAMPPGIGCLTLDYSTHMEQSLQASFHGSYGSMGSVPADVMPTIFNQGWGDWSPRPAAGLEQVAAAIWARGCRPYMGDRLRPENRLDPVSLRAIRTLGALQRRLAPLAPDAGARLVPETLVLHGALSLYGENLSRFAVGRQPALDTLFGAHRLLLDAGANTSVIGECHLENHLADARLVVLPELEAIEPETAERLRRFVEDGGCVLAVGRIPHVSGAPLSWLGVSTAPSPWQDHIYLPAWEAGGDPVLVRGDFFAPEAAEAETVLRAIQPYDCAHGQAFGWGIGPAAAEPSDIPALTRRALGRGQVWFLGARLFSCYAANANWTQIGWMRELLDRLLPSPRLRVTCDAGEVEGVCHADDRSTWAFLVNHGGEQLVSAKRWARTLAAPALPLTVELRDPQGRRPRRVAVDGQPLAPVPGEPGLVRLPLTFDAFWRIVRVDWE